MSNITNINEFIRLFGPDVFLIRNSKLGVRRPVSEMEMYNKKGHDITFMPNSNSGTTDAEVYQYNAVFIDIDAGKTEEGHYFSDDEIANVKKPLLASIKDFKLEPSIIVETRNGYHAYWLLKEKEGAT